MTGRQDSRLSDQGPTICSGPRSGRESTGARLRCYAERAGGGEGPARPPPAGEREESVWPPHRALIPPMRYSGITMVATAPENADPTVYRVEDDVGEHEIQTYILELLRPLLARYLAERDVRAHVGSDQFIYWKEHEPQQCIAPDIYVLPGVSQDIAIDVWKVWERDRRSGRSFRRVQSTDTDRVASKELGCFVRVVGRAASLRLRVATGASGDDVFPTGEEAERAAKEAGSKRSASFGNSWRGGSSSLLRAMIATCGTEV